LFDEATSSLDNRSQAIVSDALENLNVTRIVIAHRLSTVQRADRIIVLVDGRIVETGTFAELNAASGMFAAFARRQML
jgi:ATP-binding cassette subfamily C protein